MIEGLFWMLVAVCMGLPGFIGGYLLFASSDSLSIKYQNYRLNKTHKPLKDEDFSNMRSIIYRLKALGTFLLMISLTLFFSLLYYSDRTNQF